MWHPEAGKVRKDDKDGKDARYTINGKDTKHGNDGIKITNGTMVDDSKDSEDFTLK